MCLALASAPEPSSSLGPGGLLSSAIPGPVSPDAVAGAKRLFYEFGGKPVKVDRGYGSQANTQLFFSGRHEGLSIYLSRLLRPIWREKVSRLQSTPMSPNTQISNAPESVLTSVQRDLNSLKTFIDRYVDQARLLYPLRSSSLVLNHPPLPSVTRNSQLFTSGPSIEHPHDRSSEVEAWKAEQASLASLVALVTQAIEALSFVLLLIDYKLSETLLKCV
jgi:nuclear pore complex protein Nup155